MKASDLIANNVKKIVVIGPECTGKSELSKFLADHFKTVWVEEYTRAYLNKLIHGYEKSDLTKIANGQARMEDEWMYDANKVLICDTNALVVKVWSEFKYGDCDPDILKLIAERKYDLYLLTYVDVPWEEDKQREHPDKREQLWQIFHDELSKLSVPFVDIRGNREERRQKAIKAIEEIIMASDTAKVS
jgi:NadR type nicotinamide-nucleotide adenylyltransferase